VSADGPSGLNAALRLSAEPAPVIELSCPADTSPASLADIEAEYVPGFTAATTDTAALPSGVAAIDSDAVPSLITMVTPDAPDTRSRIRTERMSIPRYKFMDTSLLSRY
jgi:hypothetical protein